jgi:hypothetical protein
MLRDLKTKSTEIRVIETVGGVHFTQMKEDNYHFVLYNKTLVEQNKDIIFYKVNLDACWKFCQNNSVHGRTPTTIITFVDANRMTQIAFVILSACYSKDDLKKMFISNQFRIQKNV